MQLLFFAFEQLLFYWIFKAILLVLRLLLKALIFSPQLITSYLLCKLFLNKADTTLLWMIAIVLVAVLTHFFILMLKQIIIVLKNKGNFLWIPILIVCLIYTCIFPVWIAFNPVRYLMHFVSEEKAIYMTWLVSIAFGIYLYFRYDFLNFRSV